MPSPQFYHWAKEKPQTTNQTYGFYLRESMQAQDAINRYERDLKHKEGIMQNQLSRSVTLPAIQLSKRSNETVKGGPKNRFDINKGYTMGPTSVADRAGYAPLNRGEICLRLGSAPKDRIQVRPDMLNTEKGLRQMSAVVPRAKKGKSLYLWHSLSGCLVHVEDPK